jgi:hypothetical protein
VTSNDGTAGFLKDKVSGGYGIQLQELNDAGPETLLIASTVSGAAAGLGVYEVPYAGYSGTVTHSNKFRYIPSANGNTLLIGRGPTSSEYYFQHGIDLFYDSSTGSTGRGIGLWSSDTWPRIDFMRSNGGFSGSAYGNYVLDGDLLGQFYFTGQTQVNTGGGLAERLAGTLELEANGDFISNPFANFGATWNFKVKHHDWTGGYPYVLKLNSREALFDTSISIPVDEWSASGTIADGAYLLLCSNTSPITLELPTAVGITGRLYTFKNVSGSIVGVDAYGSELIDGTGTRHLMNQYDVLRIVSDGTNWWVI